MNVRVDLFMLEFVQFCSRYNASIMVYFVLVRTTTYIQNIEVNEMHASPDR